jgi:uncharacterized Zn finger protein
MYSTKDIPMYPYKRIFEVEETVSIPAGESGTVTVDVPDGERILIDALSITDGADVTVTSIKVDGVATGLTDSANIQDTYGDMVTADDKVTASGSNAGAGAQNLKLKVTGVAVKVSRYAS